MGTNILLEKQAGCAILTLNRPEQMNALSKALRSEFVAAFDALKQDKSISSVIITGKGTAFCAGFDLKELSSGEDANAADAAENRMAQVMVNFDRPIIAAVNGHAITGGFELALACDFIIASEQASFADTHARIGILPGWGLSQRLPRLIGINRAKELAFTGNRIDAKTACEWGLVNRVVSAEQLILSCLELAESISNCVPTVLKQYKDLIEAGYNMPLDEALRYEAAKGIESAKAASAAMIAMRKDNVIQQGREEKDREQKKVRINDV